MSKHIYVHIGARTKDAVRSEKEFSSKADFIKRVRELGGVGTGNAQERFKTVKGETVVASWWNNVGKGAIVIEG